MGRKKTLWEKFLDETYCKENENGYRPCDVSKPSNLMSLCVACESEEAQVNFEKWEKERRLERNEINR